MTTERLIEILHDPAMMPDSTFRTIVIRRLFDQEISLTNLRELLAAPRHDPSEWETYARLKSKQAGCFCREANGGVECQDCYRLESMRRMLGV
jgi:hypothetical protein